MISDKGKGVNITIMSKRHGEGARNHGTRIHGGEISMPWERAKWDSREKGVKAPKAKAKASKGIVIIVENTDTEPQNAVGERPPQRETTKGAKGRIRVEAKDSKVAKARGPPWARGCMPWVTRGNIGKDKGIGPQRITNSRFKQWAKGFREIATVVEHGDTRTNIAGVRTQMHYQNLEVPELKEHPQGKYPR